jgi:CheY-like chemotaxis protein
MNFYAHDVLIVEDELEQREEMAHFLSGGGLDVVSAANGADALSCAKSGTPKVVLLDYNLPDCTGLELAAQLRVRLPRTAILLMSGRIGGVPSETLKRLDIRVFINKPLPLKALRQAVIGLVREPVARLTGPEHSFGREGN